MTTETDFSPIYTVFLIIEHRNKASTSALVDTNRMNISPAKLLILLLSLSAASFGQLSLAATNPESAESVASSNPLAEAVLTPASAQAVDRFERLDIAGERIDDSKAWSCVADNQTNLVWEVKTVDGGIRDTNHSYTWFDPEPGNQTGVEDGGRCSGGVKCDTHHYQANLNQQRLCGYSDWRLPSREELETLVKFQAKKSRATIDERFFPAAAASWYWTASSNDSNPGYAWYVLFRNGIPLNDLKARPKHIRLVRGGRLAVADNQ